MRETSTGTVVVPIKDRRRAVELVARSLQDPKHGRSGCFIAYVVFEKSKTRSEVTMRVTCTHGDSLRANNRRIVR